MREPVAYILGRRGFRRLDLAVDRRVLIPRPETELLVEVALELGAGGRPFVVADVGTGSGAIALAVADELPTPRSSPATPRSTPSSSPRPTPSGSGSPTASGSSTARACRRGGSTWSSPTCPT